MSRWLEIYQQLKSRRVIRTAVVYAALVWGALQVADLLAEAGFISADLVRWLILAALVLLPVTVALSWFYEAPWRRRKGLSVLGDVAVMLALAVGVFLLAWQHWFASFSRPVLAVLKIEPTDTRADTADLADHLGRRLRMLLATRPEIIVLELASSRHHSLDAAIMPDRAELLGADFLLAGTLNQGEGQLRLNLQLHAAKGGVSWSEQFIERLVDLSQLESRVLNELWAELPLPEDGLQQARELITGCRYPADPAAILVISNAGRELHADADTGPVIEMLTAMIGQHRDNGLLHLARARAYLQALEQAPAPRRPVLHNLAMQDLDQVDERCRDMPEAELLRLHRTLQLQSEHAEHEIILARFPNDSAIRLKAAEGMFAAGKHERARVIVREGYRLDPLNRETACYYSSVMKVDAGIDGKLDGLTGLQDCP